MDDTRRHTLSHLDEMVNMIMEKCLYRLQLDSEEAGGGVYDIFDELTEFKSRMIKKVQIADALGSTSEGYSDVLNEISRAGSEFSARIHQGDGG